MGPLSWDEKGDLKGFEFGVFDWHEWYGDMFRAGVITKLTPVTSLYVSRDFILPPACNAKFLENCEVVLSFSPACRPDKRQRHPAFSASPSRHAVRCKT